MFQFNSNIMKKILFILIFSAVSCFTIHAQDLDYVSSKEKVYVHTNHNFFKPGETVYFKIYVLRAIDHTPTPISNVVYVEILNPSGNVLKKLNYKVGNGYAEGSFDFEENAVGGIYKIRVYTTWMKNENENKFFCQRTDSSKCYCSKNTHETGFSRKRLWTRFRSKSNFFYAQSQQPTNKKL